MFRIGMGIAAIVVVALIGLGVYASTTQSDSGFGFCGLEDGRSYEATSQEDCNRQIAENGGVVIPTPDVLSGQ